jgi:hypothetical protein
VQHLLASPRERARVRAQGAVVAEEHSFERVVVRLDELYRSLQRLC